MPGKKLKKELMNDLNLDHFVNHRIATVATLLKRQIFRIIAKNNLKITPDQWIILHYLWEKNGLTVSELAQKSRKDFANVTRIIDKLVKAGYAERYVNQNDNRISHVYVLPKAEEIKEEIHKCWMESTEISLQGINDSEQKLLLALLQKIEDNILVKMN